MTIAIIYTVVMDFGLFMFSPASLANLEMEKVLENKDGTASLANLEMGKMLENKDGMQMEREVREKEYEEPNETKGLKFNSPYDICCEKIYLYLYTVKPLILACH